MRLHRLIPLFALLISGCASLSTPTPTLTEGEMLGVPETPVGMLPTPRSADATPAPTLAPVDFGVEQAIEMPEIGFHMVIPESWSAEKVEDYAYEIRDADGNTVITVGQALGLNPDPDFAEQELYNMVRSQGVDADGVSVIQSVVGRANYILLRGDGLDACEYRYLGTEFMYLVLKFDRRLCDESNNLNDTAFTVLRSTIYTGPTQ